LRQEALPDAAAEERARALQLAAPLERAAHLVVALLRRGGQRPLAHLLVARRREVDAPRRRRLPQRLREVSGADVGRALAEEPEERAQPPLVPHPLLRPRPHSELLAVVTVGDHDVAPAERLAQREEGVDGLLRL